jgi:hypothetical protein
MKPSATVKEAVADVQVEISQEEAAATALPTPSVEPVNCLPADVRAITASSRLPSALLLVVEESASPARVLPAVAR